MYRGQWYESLTDYKYSADIEGYEAIEFVMDLLDKEMKNHKDAPAPDFTKAQRFAEARETIVTSHPP